MSASFSHDWVVKKLVDEGCETREFRGRVLRTVIGDIEDHAQHRANLPHKIPDAFKIDEKAQTVTVHEVVKTSDFDPRTRRSVRPRDGLAGPGRRLAAQVWEDAAACPRLLNRPRD